MSHFKIIKVKIDVYLFLINAFQIYLCLSINNSLNVSASKGMATFDYIFSNTTNTLLPKMQDVEQYIGTGGIGGL